MSTPPGPMLRYGELKTWLSNYKIARSELDRLIEKGVIKSYTLSGAWKLYNKAQVERDVLGPLDAINNNQGETTTK